MMTKDLLVGGGCDAVDTSACVESVSAGFDDVSPEDELMMLLPASLFSAVVDLIVDSCMFEAISFDK
jgi:hypothetical protein